MVIAEARVYTSSPVQSAFHYLKDALLSAGFDEAELQQPQRGDEVQLVIWRADARRELFDLQADIADGEGFYACGMQGVFVRRTERGKKKTSTTSFAWEMRLDYEPPAASELIDNSRRLYRVDLQVTVRENNQRRPTENIAFHYNNEAQPAKWDVVRNWVRFVLDLRSLNPAWAMLRPRIDVSEAVIDSIHNRTTAWSSPPASPIRQSAAIETAIEEQLKPFARNVWEVWALPNITRHYVCDVTREAAAREKDRKKGAKTVDLGFVGCSGTVDWTVVGKGRDDLRASLDGYRSPRKSVESFASSSTRTSSDIRTLRESQGRYSLADLDEDAVWE